MIDRTECMISDVLCQKDATGEREWKKRLFPSIGLWNVLVRVLFLAVAVEALLYVDSHSEKACLVAKN